MKILRIFRLIVYPDWGDVFFFFARGKIHKPYVKCTMLLERIAYICGRSCASTVALSEGF